MDSKIQSGQKHLSELETNVSALNVEMKEQNAELNKALEDMRKQLEEQKQILSEREKQIERFTLSQFQRDAALDSLIVGISYMLVSSPIIQWPIESRDFCFVLRTWCFKSLFEKALCNNSYSVASNFQDVLFCTQFCS